MNHDIYTIIIADDHEIVRSGLRLLIESHQDLQVEDEASSFGELTTLLEAKQYDLLILDLNLGDKNGIHSIQEISDQFEKLPVLVLSMFPEDSYAVGALKAGASGYLNKKVVSSELIKAIRKIIGGEKYISESLAENLPYGTELDKETTSPLEALSKREYEVLSLIASGDSYKEIAEKLSLSPKTVSTYRTRILDKLSLANTNQLIHFALQNDMEN
ncbi:MAG: DNA-binding response regulator [Epsilonproteobacteria bacterium]|nr:MAG: DNA-binding response regulator [Campylobacterota bacterium]